MLSLLIAAFVSADQSISLSEGSEMLVSATDDFFNQSAGDQEMVARLERGRTAIEGLDEGWEKYYLLGEVDYLYGIIQRGMDLPKEAQLRFEQSNRLLRRSLGFEETADSFRLIADNYAQLMIVNGLFYKITTGGKIREFTEKALAIDPDNVKARITLALYYLNAPAIAGGNPQRTLEMLSEVLEEKGLPRVDRFSANFWMGMTYRERDDAAAAELYFSRAKAVYPGNTWMEDL